MNIKKINCNRILTAFLLSHIIIWTIIPYISNINLPLDVIEAIAWSEGWPLGWEKHPPLSSWFPGLFFQVAVIGVLFFLIMSLYFYFNEQGVQIYQKLFRNE